MTSSVEFGRAVSFLGRIVSADGFKASKEDLETLKSWPSPTSTKAVESSLGTSRWVADFLPSWKVVARPLYEMARRRDQWTWSKEDEDAFRKAKECVAEAVTLAFPDFGEAFQVETDASGTGLGAVLSQKGRAIRIARRALAPAERALPATMLELLALTWALEKWTAYLTGAYVTVITDHEALKWLLDLKNPTGRLGQWALAQALSFCRESFDARLKAHTDAHTRQLDVYAAQYARQLAPKETEYSYHAPASRMVTEDSSLSAFARKPHGSDSYFNSLPLAETETYSSPYSQTGDISHAPPQFTAWRTGARTRSVVLEPRRRGCLPQG
jgi:hypothetical protein